MDKKMFEKLEDGFCEVLSDYAERGMKSPECVETAKAALSGLLKIKMLEEMDKFQGYSGRRSYDEDGMSRRGYRDGGSYRRSYRSYDEGYSGNHKEKMKEKLDEMYNNARDDNDRRAIEEMLDMLNK